ncbi:hypothetical protein LguiB_020372 [Lonicera macranthoides]
MASIFGHYAIIQVEVDLLHSLPHRLLVEREGYIFEVLVSYKLLHKFCSHCHIIGRLVGECKSFRKLQEAQVIDRSEAAISISKQGNAQDQSTKKPKSAVNHQF